MKKRLALLLAVLWVCLSLSACGTPSSSPSESASESETPSLAQQQMNADADAQSSEESHDAPQDAPQKTASGHEIESFEIIYQEPELPTGCEVTALAMILNYYDFDVDKVTLATEYLPCIDAEDYYGLDMDNYFIGDPTSYWGLICGTGAIVTAANDYFADCGSSWTATDLTGTKPEQLYELIDSDIPVLVWVTIGLEDRDVQEGWYTEDGRYVDWGTMDHGAVLVGYSEDIVTIADPISGTMVYDRSRFEEIFAEREYRCVIVQP